MTEVRKITRQDELDKAFEIRRIVFMEEQRVPEEEEFDQFEKESVHFLAYYERQPAGAARWRSTPEGCKLERFAVLKDYRGRGIATALVRCVIDDIRSSGGRIMYLNAQLEAIPLYRKFGFVPVGEVFMECDIQHNRMELAI